MSIFNIFKKKEKINNPCALPIQFNYAPQSEDMIFLLSSYNVFTKTFLDYVKKCYVKANIAPSFNRSEVLEGIAIDYAFWVFNHCQRLVSARHSVIENLKKAVSAEVKYIDFEVFRPCPTCSKIPKNKTYKITDNIPIYPCLDCKEDNICIFSYKSRW